MGLDIYAGTMTRYYAQNWKTAVQQWAEENGYAFTKLTPGGEPVEEEKPDPALVQQDVEAWRNAVLKAVAPEGKSYFPWREDNEKPYYTDKPDWDAYGALLLYGACHIFQEPVPPAVPKGWRFQEHPLVARAQNEALNWSLFGAECWLPLRDCFYFQCGLPSGDETVISTTGTLLADLERINSFAWQADEAEILRWTESEGYPTEGELDGDRFVKTGEAAQYDTESLAKFAFSMFYQAAAFSLENDVPILLDY